MQNRTSCAKPARISPNLYLVTVAKSSPQSKPDLVTVTDSSLARVGSVTVTKSSPQSKPDSVTVTEAPARAKRYLVTVAKSNP